MSIFNFYSVSSYTVKCSTYGYILCTPFYRLEMKSFDPIPDSMREGSQSSGAHIAYWTVTPQRDFADLTLLVQYSGILKSYRSAKNINNRCTCFSVKL